MRLDQWISFIDNNIEKDKMKVLFTLVVDKKINYDEFIELMQNIKEK
jgi:biopolymer transport protein ExbD